MRMCKQELCDWGWCQFMYMDIIRECARLYGIRKKASLSKIQSSDELSKINDIFMQDQASMNDITKAGENALVILYNGDSGDDLNALRYKLFQEKVMKSHKYVDASDYRQLQDQPSSIVLGCIIRFNSGRERLDT